MRPTSNLTTMPVVSIGIDPAMNACQRGERGMFEPNQHRIDIGRSMAETGLKPDQPVTTEPVSKEEGNRLLSLRKEALKNLGTIEAFKVHAFGETHEITPELMEKAVRWTFGNEEGTLLIPKTSLVDGHNRLAAIVVANALLIKQGKDYSELIREIPVVLFDETLPPEVRFVESTRGNYRKGGEAPAFHREVVNFWTYAVVKGNGYSEAIRDLFQENPDKKTSLRQKFSTLANLIKKYGDKALAVFEKGEIKGVAKNYNHARVNSYLQPDKTTKLYGHGKEQEPTVEEVVAFLIDPTGGPKPVSPISTKAMGDIITGSKNPVKKEVLDCVRKGDKERLAKLESCPRAWELAYRLISQGHGELVIGALEPIEKKVFAAKK